MGVVPFMKIGVEIQVSQAALFLPLARLLKERHWGARLHLYVRSRIEKRNFRRNNKDRLWGSMANDNIFEPLLCAENLDGEEVIVRVRHIEDLTGEFINQPERGMTVVGKTTCD
ncbi:MAG TPA: hypothetical protein QF772_12495 [Nitrospinaceae bacterium]|nr:hypothetical protein [Nitrospinaceae bacterium]